MLPFRLGSHFTHRDVPLDGSKGPADQKQLNQLHSSLKAVQAAADPLIHPDFASDALLQAELRDAELLIAELEQPATSRVDLINNVLNNAQRVFDDVSCPAFVWPL